MKLLRHCILSVLSFTVGFFAATYLRTPHHQDTMDSITKTRDVIDMSRTPGVSGVDRWTPSTLFADSSNDKQVGGSLQPRPDSKPVHVEGIEPKQFPTVQLDSDYQANYDVAGDLSSSPQELPLNLAARLTNQVDNPATFISQLSSKAESKLGTGTSPASRVSLPHKVIMSTSKLVKNSERALSKSKSDETSLSPLDHLSDNSVTTVPYNDVFLPVLSGQSKRCRLLNHSHSCERCTCFYMWHGEIIANCEREDLQTFPRGLPSQIWKLKMNNNALIKFNTSDILLYPKLTAIAISSNRKLSVIGKNSERNQTSNIVDLTIISCNVHKLNDRSFSIMPRLMNLSLSGNEITKLTNSTFDGLHNLRYLNVSHNKISALELATFDLLSHLEILDLSHNKLAGSYAIVLPPRLFENLQSVRELYLQGNKELTGVYPDKTFATLKNLQDLHFTMIKHQILGPEVKVLKKFKYLTVEGTKENRCGVVNITKEFFENIPHITKFEISSCKLHHISSDAFTHIKNLETLSISFMTHYNLFKALSELRALQNLPIKHLKLVRLHVSSDPCRFLNRTHGEYLKHLPLVELDLSENLLALLRDDFLRTLPTTLKRLVLRKNQLTWARIFVYRIPFLKNLIELDISDQNFEDFFHLREDKTSTELDFYHDNTPQEAKCNNSGSDLNEGAVNELEATVEDASSFSCQEAESETFQGKEDGAYYNKLLDSVASDVSSSQRNLTERVKLKKKLPRNLRIIKASGFNSAAMFFLDHLQRKSLLEDVDFSNSFSSRWGTREMFRAIKRANLNNNYCSNIKSNFFKPNNALVHLSMRDNFLGPAFSEDMNGNIFSRLGNLTYLDISRNMIAHLPQRFFRGLTKVKTLDLSDNKLQTLDVNFTDVKNLRYLYLHGNSITWVSKIARESLDEIAQLHDLYVDLRKNVLPCSCSALEIFQWLAETKVCLLGPSTCRNKGSQEIIIDNPNVFLRTLQQNCASNTMLIVSITVSTGLLGILVPLAFMYRYRWKLRYWKNVAMANWFGFNPVLPQGPRYKFDAYILYTGTSRDFAVKNCYRELEVNRGHKLCFADRDFLAGTYTISNIVGAIQSSTRTVPLIEPEFYKDELAEYGINMAVMEELHKNREVLHLCLYKPMDDEDMSRDVLRIMRRDDYTAYPPEEESTEAMRKMFWDKLSNAIGHQE